MISNGEKCRCLAVKRLSAILRGTTSKINGDYYCKLSKFIWGKKMCGKIMPIAMQISKNIQEQKSTKNITFYLFSSGTLAWKNKQEWK